MDLENTTYKMYFRIFILSDYLKTSMKCWVLCTSWFLNLKLSENFLLQYVCMTKDVLFSFIFFFPFPFLKRMVSKCNVKKKFNRKQFMHSVNIKFSNKNVNKKTPSLFNIIEKWADSKLSTDKGFHKKYIWQPWQIT